MKKGDFQGFCPIKLLPWKFRSHKMTEKVPTHEGLCLTAVPNYLLAVSA
jgi:hypothetical protein